ncbi:MAG: T9SS type A sorting domain-containing protein, partial [Flavobacteriales bacterium]
CLQDVDGDSICDQLEESGCIDTLACNFNPFVTISDSSCTYPGCLNLNACNYDPLAGCNVDSLCSFPEMYYDCDSVCLADADQDGICDVYDTTGCIIAGACNYNPLALISDSSCVFPGCGTVGACNYDPTAPCNVDSLCIIPDEGYDCTGSCIADADNDGVCNEFEIVGCTDTLACNYNEFVIDDDGSCSFNSEVTVNITVDQSEYPNGYVWQGEVFTSSGTYLYIIPNDAGCDSLITLNLTITVGIGEIIESQWNLWPNPARDHINVSGNSAIEFITILDVTGKVMLTQKYYGTINVSDFSSGMYIMQIKSSNGIEIKRFEISH